MKSNIYQRRKLRESVMYHSTSPANVATIQQHGLEVGRESAHTTGGAWADEYYGIRPIYISMQKGKYEGQPLAIDVSGMGLVADLPGLVDTGAMIEEEGMYWDEGSEPHEVMSLVDEGGILYFEDLLDPKHPASHAAIELTGTAASLESIPPSRIQITEGNNIMKITKRQLRRIIRESILLEQPMISIVRNSHEDVEDINILANYALRNDMQGALKDPALQYYINKNEAAYLVDDSYGWLKYVGDEDSYGMPAPEGWDLKKVYDFFRRFEDEAYGAYSKKAKVASASAPNRTERKAIGKAFTYDDVSEDEIASITFQLRKKAGKVVNINMEDHDHQLGNMTTGMSEEEAKRLGTTLDKIEKTLRDGGAKERKKRKAIKRSTPYYD